MNKPVGEDKWSGDLSVRNARANNLQNIRLDLPLGQLIVITGPSGSGKSSLAIDTIAAEGQRQYIENLSSYSRRFLQRLPRAEVDQIRGLPPTVFIRQRYTQSNPRSTVATGTEIHDYLRLLFARVGEITCFRCGAEVHPVSLEQVQRKVLQLPERTKLMVMAPIRLSSERSWEQALQQIRQERLVRIRLDGEVHDIEQLESVPVGDPVQLEAITDRIIVRDQIDKRLRESLELAERLGNGQVCVAFLQRQEGEPEVWSEWSFNTRDACTRCGWVFHQIEPRTFSFNSPYGRCRVCDGMGRLERFVRDRVIKDDSKPIRESIEIWNELPGEEKRGWLDRLDPIMQQFELPVELPLANWQPDQRERLWVGSARTMSPVECLGLVDILEQDFSTCQDSKRLRRLQEYRDQVECHACRGTRLSTPGNSVRIQGKTIAEWCRLSVSRLSELVRSDLSFSEEKDPIAKPILKEIARRLNCLQQVGLPYLTLDRRTQTLSDGEYQRIRLSSAIGNGLTGICYVLDEPSIGLHPADIEKLADSLRDLRDGGNTVVVVEHDEDIIRKADWLVDVGPGAGRQGGHVLASGPAEKLIAERQGTTASWLAERGVVAGQPKEWPLGEPIEAESNRGAIRIGGAKGNNLQSINVEFPLGMLVCLSGVSGSGKTTLLRETLFPAIHNALTGSSRSVAAHDSLEGVESIDRLVWVDQKPIGNSGRGCLATYSGIWNEIRKLFARTRKAKLRGFTAGRFSFNSAEGSCFSCAGLGQTKIEVQHLPDFYVPCAKCRGARFNRSTLQATYKDRNVADILNMEVAEALDFFDAIPIVQQKLESFDRMGLGYLTLGQPSNTLSGGEAQRLKLATEFAQCKPEHTLFMLDEPTTGLHFRDVRRLVEVLRALVRQGNSVIVIEHHLDLIRQSDWVIDLGPGGGDQGGNVLFCGVPSQLVEVSDSQTGRALQR